MQKILDFFKRGEFGAVDPLLFPPALLRQAEDLMQRGNRLIEDEERGVDIRAAQIILADDISKFADSIQKHSRSLRAMSKLAIAIGGGMAAVPGSDT